MKQVRFIPNVDCGLQVREPQEGQSESRVVMGKPIVFGVRSRNLTPWSSTRKVYEVLEPGCITQELLQRSDVVLNLNHSNKVTDILGRYRNSENDTLKLGLRMNGVDSECDLPETNAANDTLVLIKRGDISGMSFAFEDDYQDSENGVSYERTNETIDGKEVWIRHVKRIKSLYDVSIVTHPAYEQTNVGMREAGDEIDKAIDAQLQRECGDGKPKENECGGEETDEEKAAREAAEKAEQDKREQEEREAAEKKAQEERELEEQAERFREQQAMRLRAQRLRAEMEFEQLNY